MNNPSCACCERTTYVSKAGYNHTGSQRFWCAACRRYFTPQRRPLGYAPELRQRAVQLYLDGTSMRGIARLLNVNHQSVVNWIRAAANTVPADVVDPTETTTVEVDEVYTVVGQKKS